MIIATIKMIFTDFVSKLFNRSAEEDLKRQSDEALHRLAVSEPSQGSQTAIDILTSGQSSQVQTVLGNTNSTQGTTISSKGGSDFDKAAAILLRAGIEGGYSNRSLKDDPGGPTMRGVTWKTFNAYAGKLGLPKLVYDENNPTQAMKDKIKADMTSMITHKVALKIYKMGFWDNKLCDKFSQAGYSKTSLALFDISINSGPGRMKTRLAEVLGSASDYIAAARSSGLSDYDLANKVLDAQHRFRQTLSNWPANKGGWINRWKQLKKEIETF